MRGVRSRLRARYRGTPGIVQLAGMFVFMAVGAEEFPIAAVRRIVIVIAVLVMDFQQLQIAVRKRTCTSPAHPRKEFQCLRPITGGPFIGVAPGISNHLIQPLICLCHGVVRACGTGRQLTTKPRALESGRRDHLPSTQSPAKISQGFTVLPRAVASVRHVSVTVAGMLVPASE